MKEIWKDTGINKYQVSNLGNVRNLSTHYAAKREVKTRKNNSGYFECCLHDKGHNYFLVHRLVAKAFLKKGQCHTEVNHLNGVKTDNRAENLEWTTRSLNEIHRARVLKKGIGEANGNSRINKNLVLKIRKMHKSGKSYLFISNKTKVSKTQVARIVKRVHWNHV